MLERSWASKVVSKKWSIELEADEPTEVMVKACVKILMAWKTKEMFIIINSVLICLWLGGLCIKSRC